MAKEVNFYDNLINASDIADKLSELEDNIAVNQDKIDEIKEKLEDEDLEQEAKSNLNEEIDNLENENADLREELKPYKDFMDRYDGDRHETLISDNYFEDYARDLAEDLHGEAMRNLHWPFNCIDWERAARELQMDYTSIEFDGETFWYRS